MYDHWSGQSILTLLYKRGSSWYGLTATKIGPVYVWKYQSQCTEEVLQIIRRVFLYVFLHLLELSHSMLFYVIKFYSLMFNTHVNFIGCISLLEVLVDDMLVNVTDGDHVRDPDISVTIDHLSSCNKYSISVVWACIRVVRLGFPSLFGTVPQELSLPLLQPCCDGRIIKKKLF